MSEFNQDQKQTYSQSYNPNNPLIQTVAQLKEFTNSVRILTDSFEQLLDSVENFAPALEIVAKGRNHLLRTLNPGFREKNNR